MAKIVHTSNNITNRGTGQKADPEVFIVDNPENDLAAFEGGGAQQTNIIEPTEFVLPPSKPVDEEVQRSLESLIFMGRLSKTIELAGHKFEISTLTHKENAAIVKKLMSFGEAADLFTIRVLTLAYALRTIDGVRLDDIQVPGEFEDGYHKRMTIVDNLQIGLVERLNTEFEALTKSANETIYQDRIKN